MIDPFVLLTPVLLLGIFALLRFVGCFIKPDPPEADVVVTFDSLGAGMDMPLDGIYQTPNFALNFGMGAWFWKGSGSGNRIFLGPLSNNNPVIGSFSFVNPPASGRVLRSVRAIAEMPGATMTLDDAVNPPVSQTINPQDGLVTIKTNWTQPSPTVSVTSSVGWDMAIDTITYDGPP
jgi:hypothetical protein